jgi:glycosyltransferase involved in cell wall biosynthesis
MQGRILIAHDGADIPDGSATSRIKGGQCKVSAGYVGHLYAGKGMETIAELAVNCPDIEFHIVGGMPEDIAKWKDRLNKLNNVAFHGFVPPRDVYNYLQSFDILLAPYGRKVSPYGGGTDIANWISPLKIFEYLASGKPIVSADLASIREVLSHGETALLCEPGNIEDWVQSLELLAHDSDLRSRLGESGKELFYREYTWSVRARKVVESDGSEEPGAR